MTGLRRPLAVFCIAVLLLAAVVAADAALLPALVVIDLLAVDESVAAASPVPESLALSFVLASLSSSGVLPRASLPAAR